MPSFHDFCRNEGFNIDLVKSLNDFLANLPKTQGAATTPPAPAAQPQPDPNIVYAPKPPQRPAAPPTPQPAATNPGEIDWSQFGPEGTQWLKGALSNVKSPLSPENHAALLKTAKLIDQSAQNDAKHKQDFESMIAGYPPWTQYRLRRMSAERNQIFHDLTDALEPFVSSLTANIPKIQKNIVACLQILADHGDKKDPSSNAMFKKLIQMHDNLNALVDSFHDWFKQGAA